MLEQYCVPPHAHHLIVLLLGSLAKHDVIYTSENRKQVDTWVSNLLYFYRLEYGRKRRSRRSRTMIALQKDQHAIERTVQMIVSFECILSPPAKNGRRKDIRIQETLTNKEVLKKFQTMIDTVYVDITRNIKTCKKPIN